MTQSNLKLKMYGSFSFKDTIWVIFNPLIFKRESHKMVKHTQTIRRQFDEFFECV